MGFAPLSAFRAFRTNLANVGSIDFGPEHSLAGGELDPKG